MIMWLIRRLIAKWSVDEKSYHNHFLHLIDEWRNTRTVFYRLGDDTWASKKMASAGVSGITLDNLIIVRHECWHKATAHPVSKFVKHEMVHHMQCERTGCFTGQMIKYAAVYAWIYLFKWGCHAYYDNKYEIEARDLAGQDQIDWRERGVNRWTPWKLKA